MRIGGYIRREAQQDRLRHCATDRQPRQEIELAVHSMKDVPTTLPPGLHLSAVPPRDEESFARMPPLWVALAAGAGIGFLSGLIGVGGGIFLSPLMILLKWADTKRTAAVSAAFIWINSVAGLYGQLMRKTVDWHGLLWLVAAACAGGLAGSYLGARRLRGLWLRRTLGMVLLLATFKLWSAAF